MQMTYRFEDFALKLITIDFNRGRSGSDAVPQNGTTVCRCGKVERGAGGGPGRGGGGAKR